MKNKSLILVIEDDDTFFKFLEIYISFESKEIGIIRASDLEEGDKIFFENKENIDLVLTDACVPGHEPNSMNLIKKIKRSGFNNPIIGMSSQEVYLLKLKEAGADFVLSKSKLEIITKKITELLDNIEKNLSFR